MIDGFDEQSLANLCSEHDKKAENALYTRYAERIYALCLRYCDNPDDARDLMQEVFIKALNSIQSYRYMGEGSLYAWISRIAVNMAVNRLKRRRLRLLSFDAVKIDVAEDPPEEAVSMIPQKVMLEMISELPPVRRAVFNMFCIDGFSHKEIASRLGMTQKGSASILSKAKAQLKLQVLDYIRSSEEK